MESLPWSVYSLYQPVKNVYFEIMHLCTNQNFIAQIEGDVMKHSFSVLFFLVFICSNQLKSQEQSLTIAPFDGIIIGGYVDKGAYLNFTGPNINAQFGHFKLVLGMLPSLRFKEDIGIPKNSFITPNLGVGITLCYKIFAVQSSWYYNARTATENGKWHPGIGIGLRLNPILMKKKNASH
jgi:hypothetical protein